MSYIGGVTEKKKKRTTLYLTLNIVIRKELSNHHLILLEA